MRGSIDWQTAELTKAIFREGAKKEERTDPAHPYFQCVASYKTMETYRSVWKNFGHYLHEHWRLRDFEQIEPEHVEAYMRYKIEYYPTKQYLEKISSALGKLEIALTRYYEEKHNEWVEYDFNIRQAQLDLARNLKCVADGYHNRTYRNPQKLIDMLSNPLHRIAASIQLQGGARSEGVCLIKPGQLHGYRMDTITHKKVGIIETKEKGGKIGDILITPSLYCMIESIITENSKFRINYKDYAHDIKVACKRIAIDCHGSHGLRWTFAQNRVREYQNEGYSYEEALQGVSFEMKHFRASITEHYLG